MVLESLFPDKSIESRPIEMFIVSLLVTVAAVFSAYFVFPKYAGIITPLLVAVGMAPLIYRIFQEEEEGMDEVAEKKIKANFLQRHGETILLFSLLFLGTFVAIFGIAMVMPTSFVDSVFQPQLDDIKAVQSLSSVTGDAIRPGLLELVMANNLKVMAFAFLLSFLFATGSVFILSWNASILALYLASFARTGLYGQALAVTGGILPHAIIELLAYFLAGIAGGVLSVGLVREKWGTPEFRLLFKDSLMLMGLSVAAVLVGAAVEVGL